jgi:hypothetical protein
MTLPWHSRNGRPGASVKDVGPSYKAHPERLKLLEEPKTGHSVTDRMWSEGTKWLVLHLVEKPVRLPR